MDDAQLDEALRALAHPTRRAVIRKTVDQEVPASELADALGIAPATASEHLKVLRKSGLVHLTADGTWRRYRANLERVQEIRAALFEHLPSPAKEAP